MKKQIPALTSLNEAPQDNDRFVIRDTSSGSDKSLSVLELLKRVVKNEGDFKSLQAAEISLRPSPGIENRWFLAIDEQKLYRDTGTSWALIFGDFFETPILSVSEPTGTSLEGNLWFQQNLKLSAENVDSFETAEDFSSNQALFLRDAATGNYVFVSCDANQFFIAVYDGGFSLLRSGSINPASINGLIYYASVNDNKLFVVYDVLGPGTTSIDVSTTPYTQESNSSSSVLGGDALGVEKNGDIFLIFPDESGTQNLYLYDHADNQSILGNISTDATTNSVRDLVVDDDHVFYCSLDAVYRIEKNGSGDTTLSISGKENFRLLALDNENLYIVCEDAGQKQLISVDKATQNLNWAVDIPDVSATWGSLKKVGSTLFLKVDQQNFQLRAAGQGNLLEEGPFSSLSGSDLAARRLHVSNDGELLLPQKNAGSDSSFLSVFEEDFFKVFGSTRDVWVSDGEKWNSFSLKAENIFFDQQKIATRADHLQELLEKFEKTVFPLSTNIYSGGQDNTVKKLNSFLTLEDWSFTGHPSWVEAVAVDAQGFVYSAGWDNTLRKIDPSGNQVWSFTGHTDIVYGVAVDAQGFVYSGSQDNTLRKIDPSGNQVWSFTGHTDNVWGVAVDAQGFVYSGSQDNTVRKIDPSGNQVWSFTGHSGWVYGVAVDPQGFVYSASSDQTVRKIDPSGSQVWSFTGHTDNVQAVAVDAQGFVYSGSWDNTLRKIDPSGSQVWSFTGHSNNVRAVAVSPGLLGAGFWEE